MQTLKFLGRGSAFNVKEGNTSAYIKDDRTLLLIDCGESIFQKIIEKELLDEIDKVYVAITHLNSDHVGSLSSLIYYCYYVKNIKINIIYPNMEIVTFLSLQGHNLKGYNFVHSNISECGLTTISEDLSIIPIETTHIPDMKCYAYAISTKDKDIYYSGDSNIGLDHEPMCFYDEIYQDTCLAHYTGNVHLSLKNLCINTPKRFRSKIYIMHLDCKELIDKAKEEGFNVVEIE